MIHNSNIAKTEPLAAPLIKRTTVLSKSHSFFLFGARGTGKSMLLQTLFSPNEALTIDLLDPETANQLSAHPSDLVARLNSVRGKLGWIIIDEIQKVPVLLDIVHQELTKKDFKFALTGSSARKLKRGGANLLAGRAFVFHLHPFTAYELINIFDLNSALKWGTLPELFSINNDQDKVRFLKAYTYTYLQEEIIAEQIVRNLPPFRRFLEIVGRHTGEIVNYTNIARDVGSDAKTIQRYYEILEDTLLGFYLPAYEISLRRQQKRAKKFYFFDMGVARTLAGVVDAPLLEKTFEYGQLFENFVVNEIYRNLQYRERQFKLSYLKTTDQQEIDIIVETTNKQGVPTTLLCEIKATKNIHESHARNLVAFAKDFKNPQLLVISNDPVKRLFELAHDVHVLPWKDAVDYIVNC